MPWFGRVGLGAMHLSEEHRPPRAVAVETIHAALDVGVRLIDTADAYCRNRSETGHNEVLVGEAVRQWIGPHDEVVVATKGGHVRDDIGHWDVDGRPEHLTAAAEASRRRLGVDIIDLYQLHRPDPSVSWHRSLEAMTRLQAEGVVRRLGVSNVDVELLLQAREQIDLATVQNELSPIALESLPVLLLCHRLDMPFIVWGPFGGAGRATGLADDPKMAGFVECASERGLTVHQLVLAWLLSLSPVVTVIPGASRPASIRSSAASAAVELDFQTLDVLDREVVGRDASLEVTRSLDVLRQELSR